MNKAAERLQACAPLTTAYLPAEDTLVTVDAVRAGVLLYTAMAKPEPKVAFGLV